MTIITITTTTIIISVFKDVVEMKPCTFLERMENGGKQFGESSKSKTELA